MTAKCMANSDQSEIQKGYFNRGGLLALIHRVTFVHGVSAAILLDYLEEWLQLGRRFYLGHELAQ